MHGVGLPIIWIARLVSDRDRWDLKPIYPDREAWTAALSDIERRIETIRPFAVDVGENAGRLADCLELVFETLKDLHRVSSYATMSYDEDTRDAAAAGMAQRARLVGTGFSEAIIVRAPGSTKSAPAAFARAARRPTSSMDTSE